MDTTNEYSEGGKDVSHEVLIIDVGRQTVDDGEIME